MSESFTLPDLEPPPTDALRNVFFALRPDESVMDSIIAAGDALADVHGSTSGRRLERHRLHLTLLYLDAFAAIPESYLQHAIETGNDIATRPFDLSLDTAGSFRNNTVPWWIGCSRVPAPLTELHRQLYTGMRMRGEKARGGSSLTPHVTISYTNRGILPRTPIAPIHWRVDEVCLIDSLMGKHEFDILKSWKLRERANG